MIKVENVSMRFRMANDRMVNLKEYVIAFLKGKLKYRDFWVFQEISFEVGKGEVVGIIGKNGAGKSTLLKIIAGVLTPTKGNVTLQGNVVPMLELGSGFDMELSGRENIFLNGSILGYRKDFLEEKYEEIVRFSELQDFMEMPIRNYSSGMLMRLAFSIATIVKPEILIVDEILAVGDEAFQKKSKRKMLELMSGGTTVLFVSHSMEQIREMCNRVVWLENGKINMIGEVKKVCDAYQEFMNPTISLENQLKERKRNTDAEKYYMDILFIYGELGEDYEWRVHNQKEQLLAGNMASAEIYYQDLTENLIAKYRTFFFVGCPDTEEIKNYIDKLKAFHKTILFDCSRIEEWRTNQIFQKKRTQIDGIVAATEQIAKEIKKEFLDKVYINKDVCSDRIEQLSEWAVYDRDVLPEKDVEQMSGDMEVVNYYRAVKKREEREKGKLRIGCFSLDEKTVKDLLEVIFLQEQETEVYLNPEVPIRNFQNGNDNWDNRKIQYLESMEQEKLPRIYADMDMILAVVQTEKDERAAYQEKIYAGLVKTSFFIWYKNGENHSKREDFDSNWIAAETAAEFYEEVKRKYQQKEWRRKEIEKNFKWVKEEATAVRTGWKFTKWIQKKEKSQVVFLLRDGWEEKEKETIEICARKCKQEGKDVLYLWDEGNHPVNENPEILSLVRTKNDIYGSFDHVVATSWEECEFLQSYSNISKRFFLQQKESMEEYSSGDYTRFRMMQAYEPYVEITLLAKEKFLERYKERLRGKNLVIRQISDKAKEWYMEVK